MNFSDEEKLKCLEREIALRKVVFPKRIAAEKMSRNKADREIALMEAIADDYRKRVPAK
jgi:hypothetical protein